MSAESMIHLQLEFSGALLPVETNEQGQKVVPLKPISDAIRLEWERQRKKVFEQYLSKRLGSCTVPMYWADRTREMVCIRLDRVSTYLNMLNPEMVRAQGNETAADFLEAKQAEWDDLIDAYERGYGILAKGSKVTARKPPTYNDYLKVIDAKKKTGVFDERKVLDFMARKIAQELGVPMQAGVQPEA